MSRVPLGKKSKSHDDSVQLSRHSNEPTKQLKSLSVSSASSKVSIQRTKDNPHPHRLRDNLHWRCSNCDSLVATSETNAHLIGCLLGLVGPYIDSRYFIDSVDSDCSYPVNQQMHSTAAIQTIQCRSNDRPRTKKLERPTPNIKHPVIDETTIEADDETDNSIGLSTDSGSSLSRKITNCVPIHSIPENGSCPLETTKCNLNTRIFNNKGTISNARSITNWPGSGRVYPPPPPVPPSTATTVRSETKKVCNSCDRSSAPERLHSHHAKASYNHYNNNNNHHHHHNNKPRVSLSPTKDMNKKSFNAKSPTVVTPKRISPKSDPNNQSISKTSDYEGNDDLPSNDSDENPKKKEENKNGLTKNNISDHPNPIEYSEQRNNSSLQLKCYLCRKDFGTDEIETHEIECFEKYKHDNSVLSPSQRVPVTTIQSGGLDRRGSHSSIAGCDPAGWAHFKSQLTPCPKCGRTFFPHRLAAHEKACLGPQIAKRSKNAGQIRNTVHAVTGKDKTQINQFSKCNKKSVASHPTVGSFACNKNT